MAHRDFITINICVWMWTHVPQHICGGQRTNSGNVPLLWVPGIKDQLSGLGSSHLYTEPSSWPNVKRFTLSTRVLCYTRDRECWLQGNSSGRKEVSWIFVVPSFKTVEKNPGSWSSSISEERWDIEYTIITTATIDDSERMIVFSVECIRQSLQKPSICWFSY